MTIQQLRQQKHDLIEEKNILQQEMHDTRFWMHSDGFETRLDVIEKELHALRFIKLEEVDQFNQLSIPFEQPLSNYYAS